MEKNIPKILMIAECPRNLDDIKGGLEAASVNLILGFRNQPVDLYVLSIRNDLQKDETVEVDKNIHIYYFGYSRKSSKFLEFLFFGRRKVAALNRYLQPDIIHMQGTGPALLMLRGLDKKKVVITQHGIMQEELKYKIGIKKKVKFLIKSAYDRILLARYKNYISISHYNRKFLAGLHKTNGIHTEVIYNAVNPLFFGEGLTKDANRIIFVGLVNKLKGVHLLIEAFKELKKEGIPFTLDIVGGTKEPLYFEEIRQSIKLNGLENQVVLHGWKNQKEVKALLTQNAIFVLPSLQECLPISIAEAMAAGRVVVATNTGGIPEMYTDRDSGFLFAKNDSKQLSEILKFLYYHPEEVTRVSSNAKKDAFLKYQPRKVAEQTLQFYKSVLQS